MSNWGKITAAEIWAHRKLASAILAGVLTVWGVTWKLAVRPAIAQVVEEEVDGRVDALEAGQVELQQTIEQLEAGQSWNSNIVDIQLEALIRMQQRMLCLQAGRTDCE